MTGRFNLSALAVRELRIEIDEALQSRKVAEITETDYFRDLRGRAGDLRRIASDLRARPGRSVLYLGNQGRADRLADCRQPSTDRRLGHRRRIPGEARMPADHRTHRRQRRHRPHQRRRGARLPLGGQRQPGQEARRHLPHY